MKNRVNKIAKILRKKSTKAEKLLWKYLKAKQLDGFKFRRQEPIGNYIVDFVCFEKRIVIEADGGQHSVNKDKDEVRNTWFTKQGFKILRFWDNEILKNPEGVLEVIRMSCIKTPSPLTPPIKGGVKQQKII